MKQKEVHINENQPLALLHDYGAAGSLKVISTGEVTKPVIIQITGKNILPPRFLSGKLEKDSNDIKSVFFRKHLTSSWFPVSSEINDYLVMSGDGYNCALWQFINSAGEPAVEPKNPKFMELRDPNVAFQGKTYSIAKIPEGAVFARVYFADRSPQKKRMLGKKIQIEYGRIPTYYEPYREAVIKLPPLAPDAVIRYDGNEWIMKKQGTVKKLKKNSLTFGRGDIIRMKQGSQCDITLQYDLFENGKGRKYGIRHKMDDPCPACERIDDAKGLHNNYFHGSRPATPYKNDFDSIYPWSKIRLCAVSINEEGQKSITYQGEEGFSRDGSSGQVMVEIPKFYIRREVKDGYESIWISKKKLDGFELDPAFLTDEGSCEHVYIGAYLSSKAEDKLKSASQTAPMIRRTMNEIREMAANTEGNFKECDLRTIMAVQKLFMIETATLDSQSIFEGVVFIPYLIKKKASTYYARKDAAASNTIVLGRSSVTRRFVKGDNITIIKSWSDYQNVQGEFQRKVVKTRKLEGNLVEITFSGAPIDIVTKKSGISCLPRSNGDTDRIKYHSGSRTLPVGHASFKYRHIENLWGNLSIYVEDAWVLNNRLYMMMPNGIETEINYDLPVQDTILLPNEFGEPAKMCIKEMGFDPAMPSVMFPSVIGNGASTSNFYCDAWYNMGKQGKKYVITFGGAWDNKAYAGIFDFRAEFNGKSRVPYNGSRIMLRE